MHYHFDTTDETLKAWTLGLGSHPLPWEVIRKSVKEDSVSFRSLAKRKIIKECWKTGRPFYYIDTGYVGNLIKKKIFFRVVKNNVQHSQVFKCPDDRWKKIARISPELDFVEWRKNNNGKILLVTPSEKPCKFYGIDRNQWVEKTIKKLKQHTDREIIIRDKEKRHARVGANSVPWYLIKEGIYALVTYQSIAAIEAICTGVPAFTEELTAADSVACNDLSKIESPNYAPTEQVKEWQHWLAYCQYHFKEMQSGEAVRIMKEYGLM